MHLNGGGGGHKRWVIIRTAYHQDQTALEFKAHHCTALHSDVNKCLKFYYTIWQQWVTDALVKEKKKNIFKFNSLRKKTQVKK